MSSVIVPLDPTLKPGDKVGIAFDHGILQHPVYGTATKVSGIFPLMLTFGDYPIPAIANEPERLKKLVQKTKSELDESSWENELDEVIDQKIKDYILITAFTNPAQDIETPKMHAGVLAVIASFIADDILDAIENSAEIGLTYANGKLADFLDNIMIGVYEKFEDIPHMVPEVVPLLSIVWQFKCECEAIIPNFRVLDAEARYERKKTLDSFILLMEDSKSSSAKGDGFSEEIMYNFFGNTSAMVSALEFFVLIEGVIVSEEIREDILFRKYKQCVANISSLMNAIFGLPKDMRVDQVNDSPILRQVVNNGTPLQTAFDKTMKFLQDSIQDMRIVGNKLKISYKNNSEVAQYIRCSEYLVDGEFYWYSACERYGKLNMKITKCP